MNSILMSILLSTKVKTNFYCFNWLWNFAIWFLILHDFGHHVWWTVKVTNSFDLLRLLELFFILQGLKTRLIRRLFLREKCEEGNQMSKFHTSKMKNLKSFLSDCTKRYILFMICKKKFSILFRQKFCENVWFCFFFNFSEYEWSINM